MWYVYIIDKNKVFYTGMTSDLIRRIQEHRNEGPEVQLLYKEVFPDKFQAAKKRETNQRMDAKKEIGIDRWEYKFTEKTLRIHIRVCSDVITISCGYPQPVHKWGKLNGS